MIKYIKNVSVYFTRKDTMDAVMKYLLLVPTFIIILLLYIHLLISGYLFECILGFIPVFLFSFLFIMYPITCIMKPFIWHMCKDKIQSEIEFNNDDSQELKSYTVNRLMNKYLLYKRPYFLLFAIGTGAYVKFIIGIIDILAK